MIRNRIQDSSLGCTRSFFLSKLHSWIRQENNYCTQLLSYQRGHFVLLHSPFCRGTFWYKCSSEMQIWCEREGSWACGRIRTLIPVTLFPHSHHSWTVYCAFPHWQVGNGHRNDGMALKRQDVPKWAGLRKENTAPEQHPKEPRLSWNIQNSSGYQGSVCAGCSPSNYWRSEKEKILSGSCQSLPHPRDSVSDMETGQAQISIPRWFYNTCKITEFYREKKEKSEWGSLKT